MNLRIVLLSIVLLVLTFSFTGCFKWAARASDKLPKETALDKEYGYKGKVVIIGAGAAGLAAGKVLEKNNVDYIILEATNRYGGRLKKDTSLADFPIDIGAEWIHSAPIVLNIIKGKKGVGIDEDLIPYKLDEGMSWDGKELKPVSKKNLNFRYNFMPESKFKRSTWYDFIDENIARDVKDKIHYNTVVEEIDYSKDKIEIKSKDGQIHMADKVLVTVSMGVLKSGVITFVPEMGKQKKEAVEKITFETGFKMVMKFNGKFYPDAIDCKVKSGEKSYYDIAFKKESEYNILGLLAKGDVAMDYYSLGSKEAIVKSVIEELDLMFEGKASESFTGEYILEDWGRHQYTLGTWTKAFEHSKSTLDLLNEALDKKVYFAGEINDPYQQMGVPGAVLSGYYSIDRLLMNKE